MLDREIVAFRAQQEEEEAERRRKGQELRHFMDTQVKESAAVRAKEAAKKRREEAAIAARARELLEEDKQRKHEVKRALNLFNGETEKEDSFQEFKQACTCTDLVSSPTHPCVNSGSHWFLRNIFFTQPPSHHTKGAAASCRGGRPGPPPQRGPHPPEARGPGGREGQGPPDERRVPADAGEAGEGEGREARGAVRGGFGKGGQGGRNRESAFIFLIREHGASSSFAYRSYGCIP